MRAPGARKLSLAAAIKLDRSARGTPTPDPSPQGGGEGKARLSELILTKQRGPILPGTVAAFCSGAASPLPLAGRGRGWGSTGTESCFHHRPAWHPWRSTACWMRAHRARKLSLAAAIKLDRTARGTPTPDPSPQGGGEGKPLAANFDETTLADIAGNGRCVLLRRLLLPSPLRGGVGGGGQRALTLPPCAEQQRINSGIGDGGQGRLNLVQHSVDIAEHLVVPES